VRRLGVLISLTISCCLAAATAAAADDWLPHPAGAVWHYTWVDSVYNPAGIDEKVTVCDPAKLVLPCPTSPWFQTAGSFTLGWASEHDLTYASPEQGIVSFQDTNGGLLNTNWQSTPPPPQMPVLCATTSNCANSLASAYYNVIWGTRAPLLSEPLLQGLTWSSTGGAANDVVSSSQYVGQQRVSVPAFKTPVLAAAVRTEITQAGAIGDPYGSGIRTTWWVRGVGPVKVIFEHTGGTGAPATTVTLQSTSLTPQLPPPDPDYFPLRQGQTAKYRWTNSRHLPQPEVEKVSTDVVVNRSARVSVKSVSGPIRTVGIYGYTARLDGVSNIFGSVSAATLAKLPPLGHGRHFFTPIDLLNFGINPLLPAYPRPGSTWSAVAGSRDFQVYGVTGRTTVLGVQTVRVPAGRFTALAVRSVLTQRGHPFGSGVRTVWFAPGRGMVKLLFRHGDGSVSLVELLK
jgi:hypothetical protein